MANPTIDATVEGASANSYVTQSTAQTDLDGRLDVPEWTAADTNDKDRALIMATGRLDIEEFLGNPKP